MFEAILPKRKLIDTAGIDRKLKDELSVFAIDTLRTCAAYEPPPSASYRRTNILKGSWSKYGPQVRQGALEVIVVSSGKVAPYNIFVRGPKKGQRRQARRMAARGWRSVTDIVKDYWPMTRKRLLKIMRGA